MIPPYCHMSVACSFLLLSSVLWYRYNLLIPLFTDKLLGYFQFKAIINNTATDIHLHFVCGPAFISLE